MNNLLYITFLGTNYHGFQVQKNANSICAEIQNAMQALFGCKPDVKGCSRTDSGVHANEYCLSFKHDIGMEHKKLPLAMNTFLPQDIRVFAAKQVAEDFHARYSCVAKSYKYVILNSHVDNPFCKGQYYRVPYKLDEARMNEAAAYFIAKQDFAAFMSKNSDIEDTVRTISHAKVEREGEKIIFSVKADGFLYNMVRIMAGTLLKIGAGRWPAERAQQALESKQRKQAGDTLPAEGLFLDKVFYSD